jgi:acyl carrier protein
MTDDEIKAVVFESLAGIAPEADLSTLAMTTDLREAIDLDSMDVLNFAIALHSRLKIDIPEADYPKLLTLERAIGYLSRKVAGNGG